MTIQQALAQAEARRSEKGGLTGSAKDIAWAETLIPTRRYELEQMLNNVLNPASGSTCARDELLALTKRAMTILANTDARWWINNRINTTDWLLHLAHPRNLRP